MANEIPHITVKIESDNKYVPLDAFLTAVKGMRELAAEIDRSLDVDEATKHWNIVGLELGSAVLTMSPQTTNTEDAMRRVRVMYEGIESVQSGQSGRPENFTDAALNSLKAIGAIATRYNDTVRVTVQDTIGTVNLNTQTVAHIEDWLGGKYQAVGSVEGKLDQVSIHRNKRFSVYDRLDHEIRCSFKEDMMPQVKAALGERVTVRGMISYRADGVPVSIKPDNLYVLRSDSELPQPEDVTGIWDIDVSSEEYVRSLHDS